MFRFLIPTILIIISVAGFLMFTQPMYQELNLLRKDVAAYSIALNNSRALDAEQNELIKKQNAINVNDLKRLEKLLPDSVDNIKLILEIEKIASPYGMILQDVKYEVLKEEEVDSEIFDPRRSNQLKIDNNQDYGIWDLEFAVQGTYYDFLNFIKNLEKNLRIVDISSIEFISESKTNTGLNLNSNNNYYKFKFKIKTYWLKN